MTSSSTQEQGSAGLLVLSKEEVDFFQTHNQTYKEKFGFPFIICVRLNKKEGIMSAMPKRCQNSYEEEFKTALEQVKLIAELRLKSLLVDPKL